MVQLLHYCISCIGGLRKLFACNYKNQGLTSLYEKKNRRNTKSVNKKNHATRAYVNFTVSLSVRDFYEDAVLALVVRRGTWLRQKGR